MICNVMKLAQTWVVPHYCAVACQCFYFFYGWCSCPSYGGRRHFYQPSCYMWKHFTSCFLCLYNFVPAACFLFVCVCEVNCVLLSLIQAHVGLQTTVRKGVLIWFHHFQDIGMVMKGTVQFAMIFRTLCSCMKWKSVVVGPGSKWMTLRLFFTLLLVVVPCSWLPTNYNPFCGAVCSSYSCSDHPDLLWLEELLMSFKNKL